MNKAILIGNVGRDPNVRYFEGGRAVAQVTLATTERGYTLQNGTQVPDRTEWHNLVFRNGLAQTVEKYVHKGDSMRWRCLRLRPTSRHQRHLSQLLLRLNPLLPRNRKLNQQKTCRFNNMFN